MIFFRYKSCVFNTLSFHDADSMLGNALAHRQN
jgi:hypothetical protein